MYRYVVLVLAASCAAPLVHVEPAKPRGHCGQTVVVIGGVSQPGKFTVEQTPTLLQAIDRAGGFTAEARQHSVVVERCAGENWEDLRVACDRAARGSEGDLRLKAGDIVHVPTWDQAAKEAAWTLTTTR
jgi:protein involved in polysaccharide export with SLBB domain